MSNFFSDKANGMSASNKLPFFPSGYVGRTRVSACKGITNRTGDRAFIVEFEIVTSNLPDVYVGGKYSWYQGLAEPDTAYAACIGFLYAALGLDPVKDKQKIELEIKPHQSKWLNNAVSDANPLAGAEMIVQTSTKKTKKNTDFTLHTFSVVTANAVAA